MQGKWAGTSLPYVTPRRSGQPDAWTEESASQGGSQRLIEVATTTPPTEIAERLKVPEGGAAVLRRRLMYMADEPVEIVDSWYPESIASGTALAEHRKIRGGAPTLLAELGHAPQRVIEEVGMRPSTGDEADQLGIAEGENVLTLLRTSLLADDQPLEASLMVMKGPRYIRYEMEVS